MTHTRNSAPHATLAKKGEAKGGIKNPTGIRIVGLQLALTSLLALPIFVFSFMYGGASLFPTAFFGGIGFLLVGLALGYVLVTRPLLPDVLAALAWLTTFWALLAYSFARSPGRDIGALFTGAFLSTSLAVVYLGFRAARMLVEVIRGDPALALRRGRLIALAAAAAGLIVAAYWGSWHTLAGARSRLKSRLADVRCMASGILGRMGPAARDALPDLLAAFDELVLCSCLGEAKDMPIEDVFSLGGFDALLGMMSSRSELAREAATCHLAHTVNPLPDDRFSALKTAFAERRREGRTRGCALEGLGRVVGQSFDLRAEVNSWTTDSNEGVREAARKTTRLLDAIRAAHIAHILSLAPKMMRVARCAAVFRSAHPTEGYPAAVEELGSERAGCLPAGDLPLDDPTGAFSIVYARVPDGTGRNIGYRVEGREVGAPADDTSEFVMDQSGLLKFHFTSSGVTKTALYFPPSFLPNRLVACLTSEFGNQDVGAARENIELRCSLSKGAFESDHALRTDGFTLRYEFREGPRGIDGFELSVRPDRFGEGGVRSYLVVGRQTPSGRTLEVHVTAENRPARLSDPRPSDCEIRDNRCASDPDYY